MITADVAADDELGVYARYLPDLNSLRETFPDAEPLGSAFKGGFVLRRPGGEYIGVMLPPFSRSEANLHAYLGEHIDGGWDIVGHEYFGQVEAVRLVRR